MSAKLKATVRELLRNATDPEVPGFTPAQTMEELADVWVDVFTNLCTLFDLQAAANAAARMRAVFAEATPFGYRDAVIEALRVAFEASGRVWKPRCHNVCNADETFGWTAPLADELVKLARGGG